MPRDPHYKGKPLHALEFYCFILIGMSKGVEKGKCARPQTELGRAWHERKVCEALLSKATLVSPT